MKPLTVALTIGVIVLGFFVVRSCGGPDPAYWVAKADYDQLVKDREADFVNAQAAFAELERQRVEARAQVDASALKVLELKRQLAGQQSTGSDLAAENARLKADVQAVIDANPKLRLLIDNYDLRLSNKDEQIFTLSGTVKELEFQLRRVEEVSVIVTKERTLWKKQYDDEHGLRLALEVVNKSLEKSYRSTKTITKLAVGGVVVATAVVILTSLAK